jgi:cytochrome oxidase Cu insertion factor (SCO1/SenC/PrrC family)
MARLAREFETDDRIRFVSISVDPETDTPQRLAEYAGRYGADPLRWKFLTGPVETINDLAQNQFLLGFGGEPVQHSSRFVLVDGDADILGFFDGTDPQSVAELRDTLAELQRASQD